MSYLLDANVFIMAKNLHYGFDFCPTFWDWLDKNNKEKKVLSVEKVLYEIEGREDVLSDWIQNKKDSFFIPPDAKTTPFFGQVTQWINKQNYTQVAQDEFLAIADFFLIAQALQGSHSVVSHERPSNSKKRIKITDVCLGLGVKFMTPFDMLRIEKARFGENVEGPGEDTNWVYIADRESDIYEVFVRLDQGVDYVIRSCYNRSIEKVKDQAIFQKVRESEVLGEVDIPVRARPGRAARTAVAKVRSCTAILHPPKRPGMKLPVLEPIKIVEVFEEKKPNKEPALHWILLTSLPADTFEQALYIAKLYEKRWLVEEYHKALKSGTKIEQSQFGSMSKIDALLGIMAVLAVRLLALKNGREDDNSFTPEGDEQIIVEILEHKGLRPNDGWTRRGYVRAIARVGGFLARKGDGEPGWQSIWTGMFRLLPMVEGIKMARGFNNSG